MIKEVFFYGMMYVYLFVIGYIKEDVVFNVYDEEFKCLMYKLNYDFMIVDVYRL